MSKPFLEVHLEFSLQNLDLLIHELSVLVDLVEPYHSRVQLPALVSRCTFFQPSDLIPFHPSQFCPTRCD